MTGISWITVIWSMGAAASLTLAVLYFSIWARGRAQAHLLFAVTAAAFAVYATFELRIMFAQTTQQLDAGIRWGHVPLAIGLLGMIGFVSSYLGTGRRWLLWTIVGLRAIFVVPSLFIGGNPNLEEIPSLEQIQFLGETVTLNRGIPRRWFMLGPLTVLLMIGFLADATLSAWRRGDRRKALVVGGSSQFFIVVGLGTTVMVAWADLKIPLANSLYYQVLVAVMGYELSRDVLRASQLALDLRASEARSQAILRAVPDLMFLQSLDGVYVDYHASRPDRLFLPPESFLGRHMREVLPPPVIGVLEPAFGRAKSSAETVVVEYELPSPDDPRLYEARLVRNDNDQVLTLVRDVTERRRAELALRDRQEALARSQRRYMLATEAGRVGVWDWNFETNELFVDPRLKALLGYDDGEISTDPADWGSRVHPDDVALATAGINSCVDGVSDNYEIEHRMLHKDGGVKWMLSRGSALRGADNRLLRLVGTKVDITERKHAEDVISESQAVLAASHREIHDLAGRLIAAQEVERTRIARDLHDDFSQQLAGFSIALSGLKRRVAAVEAPADLQNEVAALQQRSVALAESIRSLSHDLHPSVLQHAGLVAAVRAHCAELERRQGLSIAFKTEGEFDSIVSTLALCVYRVAQEGLRNVVTHSGAQHAEVRLNHRDDAVELTLEDDGRGFDIAGAGSSRRGLGLVSINERVRLEGGNVSIVTASGKGTRLRVTIPTRQPPGPGS